MAAAQSWTASSGCGRRAAIVAAGAVMPCALLILTAWRASWRFGGAVIPRCALLIGGIVVGLI
jgi:hypothetical protein